ncbi:MAG TPA: phage antirepressor N-terminal domain-containing protein [Rhodopila sp.]
MALTTVDFHGTTILVQQGDTPEATLVAMKPVVEGMGLDWGGQHKKLLSHPVLAKGISVMEIPSDGGGQTATALPLTRLNFWMATINPNRIKEFAIRTKVIEYQTECADALFAHFFGQATKKGEAYIYPKPFDEWTLEEIRTQLAVANGYRHTLNNASAAWYLMRAGFPKPPDRLLPTWWQAEFDLRQPAQNSLTVIFPESREKH